MPTRLVITGAPASAKTSFFERLKSEPRLADFLFFDEIARQILTENPDFRHRWSDFHREIYRRQNEREQAAADRSFITDRGTVDAFAFHPETMRAVGTTIEREYGRYTAVIQLGSAAALGEPCYTRDDVRNESVAEALEIERALRAAWSGHPRYYFVEALPEIEEKYRRFREIVVNNIVE